MSTGPQDQTNQKDCPASSSRIELTADCCGGSPADSSHYQKTGSWTSGSVHTAVGDVLRVRTDLTLLDRLGHWRVRWNIGRMRYAIAPGLYAVGNPTKESPVFASANFKMSFDQLRAALADRDGWIMVLDTKGINVWCAAGKGTFGTLEIVNRIAMTRLREVISHRNLIVPQLGATGVKAHEVRQFTGFTVHYGPVRVEDLPMYLDSKMKATAEMRRIRFDLRDRLPLVPVELISWGKWALLVVVAMALLGGFGSGWFSWDRVLAQGFLMAVAIIGGLLAGTVLTPVLLPWLPGRAFALKGAWAGLMYLFLLGVALALRPGLTSGLADTAAGVLLVLTVASFTAMNFTGASTYTSLSGVRKEMRAAVPVQSVAGVIGLGFWVVAKFV